MRIRPAGADIHRQPKHHLTIRLSRQGWATAWAVVLVLLFSSPVAARDKPAFESPAPLLDEVATLVWQHVFDAGVADRAVEAHAQAAAQLDDDPSEASVDLAVAGFLADLGVSHLGRYQSNQVAYYELLDIFSGAGFVQIVDRIFDRGVVYDGIGIRLGADLDGLGAPIIGVYDGGPADRAGLMAGERLLAVQGGPADPVLAFQGLSGQTVPLDIRGLDGRIRQVPVDVTTIRPNRLFRQSIAASARILPDAGGSRLGYLRIWSWAGRPMQAAVAEVLAPGGALAGADGLVLDLRWGWGGARPDYADLFVGGAPQTETIDRDGARETITVRWQRPMVVLIGPETRSGKEIVAYGLQRSGVPLVGTRSAGAVLAARPFLLSDNSLLTIPVLDVVVDGIRLEGTGLQPDIPVSPGPPGEDPQLDMAVEVLTGLVAEEN